MVEYEESGLQCDNPKCDFTDKEVPFSIMHEHINKECPKCGENLLTQEDYNNAKVLDLMVSFINSLTEEEMKELAPERDSIGDGKYYTMEVNTHKKLSVESIKPCDDGDNI